MEQALEHLKTAVVDAFFNSPVIISLAGLFVLYLGWQGLTRARRLKKAAVRLAETAKFFEGDVEIAEVDLVRDFPKLNHEFYGRQGNVVELLGFEHAGDVEFLHLSRKQPWMRTCIRLLVPAHGEICAAIHHLRISGWRRLLCKFGGTSDSQMTEFETELDNGTFVLTTNSEEAGKLSQPDSISMHVESSGLTASQLLNAHIQHVKEHLGKFPEARPVPARTIDEVSAMQARFHAAQQAHRESLGGFSSGELETLIGDAVADGEKATLIGEVGNVQSENAEVSLRQPVEAPETAPALAES